MTCVLLLPTAVLRRVSSLVRPAAALPDRSGPSGEARQSRWSALPALMSRMRVRRASAVSVR